MGLLETILNLDDKSLKIPENKVHFSSDSLYRDIWKNGEVEAFRYLKDLEIKAQIAGATREFKKRFQEARANYIKGVEGVNEEQVIDFMDLPRLTIPRGYRVEPNTGISKFNESTLTFDQICPQVVFIESRYINIDSGEEKNKITFIDRFRPKSLVVEAETVSNSRSIVKLRNSGIMVTSENARELVIFLSEFLSVNIYKIEPENSISRVGWHKGEFIPFTDTFVFDGEKENKHLFEAIDTSGDLDSWVNYFKDLRKNKLFRMQLAASFSSPLIELTNSLPFVFHLWGGTGAGKTVALMASMSVWGNPSMGKLVRTMNMTQNSMMTTAGFLYNIPFAGDELQIIKSRWSNYDNLIMAITEGVDRGRMDGHVNRELKRWHCNFLFTGEEPCTTSSSGGGAKNRVIEIECTHKLIENGNEVVNFVKENYGLAGRKFLESIDLSTIQAEYIEIFNELIKDSKSTEKQAMSLALILLADRITCRCLFNDEPLKISDVVDYLKDDTDVDISERAFSYLVDWIAINKQYFSGETEDMQPAKQVYGKIDRKDENIIYIINTSIKDALHNSGFSLEAIVNKWKEKGYLIPSSSGRNVHAGVRINGARATCYKINLESIQEDEMFKVVEEDCSF